MSYNVNNIIEVNSINVVLHKQRETFKSVKQVPILTELPDFQMRFNIFKSSILLPQRQVSMLHTAFPEL